jgi:predicted RNase H-like HicB family nuclease
MSLYAVSSVAPLVKHCMGFIHTVNYYLGIKYAIFTAMKKVSLKNIIWKEGAYYVAQCLNVDVSSFGKTKKEAILNIQNALALYFDNPKNRVHIQTVSRPEIVNQQLTYAETV